MKTPILSLILLHLTGGLLAGTLNVVPADQPIDDPAHQFHSLQEAVDASRKSEGCKSIRIHPGEYFDTTVSLNEKDSGLTIEGYGNQTVLYGGIQLAEWQPAASAILAKAGWVMAKLPSNAKNIRVLEIDGEKRPRARLPQEGRLTHESEFEGRWQSTASGGFDIKPTHEQLTTFIYKAGELGNWPGITNGEVTLFHSWSETLVSITGVDALNRTVRFTPESGYPPGGFGYYEPEAYKYIVWNIREGMQRPGQWYWDKTDKVLYYWQLPGEDIRERKVVIPMHEKVITIRGADNVSLKGFSVRASTAPMIMGSDGASFFDGAVSAEKVTGLKVEEVNISNVTAWGIKAFGNHITIRNCEIAHTGAGAIRTRGDHVTVEDCSLHDVGEIYYSATALHIRRGRYATVSHNEIYNTSYNGMCIQCSESIVEYNLIYNMMRELKDGAAIYFTYNSGWEHFNYTENCVARNNIVIGGQVGSQVRAFYFDEYSRNCTFENNLAINAGSPVHLHMALDCKIINNIFIDRGIQKIDFPRSHGITYERNIAVADAIQFITPLLDSKYVQEFGDYTKYPKDKDFADKIKRYATGITEMKDNLFYSRLGKVDYINVDETWARTSVPLKEVKGAILANPGFRNIAESDFWFTQASPAAEIGFNPINLGEVGRRTTGNPCP